MIAKTSYLPNETLTPKTALSDMPDAPQSGEKAMRAYQRTDLSLCSSNRPPWDRCSGQSIQQRGIQARRRTAYLDQVAQDLLHLGGINDDGQHSHFRGSARTDPRIDLVHLSDQPRPCGACGAFGECAHGRLRFRVRAVLLVRSLPSRRGVSCNVLPQGPFPLASR